MNTFSIPTKEEVSPLNRKYFDYFNDRLGMVPNLYAMLAYSDTGLESYIQLQSRKQRLSMQEKAIIGLVVGAINESTYCLETHSMIARLNGLTEAQIREVQYGTAGFDPQYDALARLVHSMVINKGKPAEAAIDRFFVAGYTNAHLVDVVLCIGDNMISNMLTRTMDVPSDHLPGLSC